MTRGFYSRVKTPVALRVCKDSRDAVLSSNSTCFGNLMFTPRTLFNFSLDTLYIGAGIDIQQQLMHLIGSMNATEISKLQSLAIDNDINTDWEIGADAEFDYEACVKKAASLMPNLRVFLQVFDLAGWFLEDGIGEGIGAMELYLEWPTEVEDMHICPNARVRRSCGGCGGYHGNGNGNGFEDSDGSEYYYDEDDEDVEYCDRHDLPDDSEMKSLPSRPDGSSAPKVSAIWGWRPTK